MDRGYALAWNQLQRERCTCGTYQDEWDPPAGWEPTEDEPEWVPYVSHHYTCPGHQLLAEEQDRFQKDSNDRPMPGQFAYLVPIELAHTVLADD